MSFTKRTVLLALLAAAAVPTTTEARRMGMKKSSSKQSSSSITCGCDDKEYVVNSMVMSFWFHQQQAIDQGCQLAIAEDRAEANEILAALTASPPNPALNTDGQALAWVGFARPGICPTMMTNPPTPSCTTGSLAEGWQWLDGCTPFDTTLWGRAAAPLEPNDGAPGGEYLGGIWYATANAGGLGDIPGYYMLPAVYECCVVPSSSKKSKKSRGGGMKKSSSRRLRIGGENQL